MTSMLTNLIFKTRAAGAALQPARAQKCAARRAGVYPGSLIHDGLGDRLVGWQGLRPEGMRNSDLYNLEV